jgi:hypothetical protein
MTSIRWYAAGPRGVHGRFDRRSGPDQRSTRSHAAELPVTLIVFAVIYLFLVNGGPTVAGKFLADLIGTR